MNFLKNLFGQKAAPARSMLPLKVRCRRCGEIIETHVDLANELSVDYDETDKTTYHCRKGLIGNSTAIRRSKLNCSSTPTAT